MPEQQLEQILRQGLEARGITPDEETEEAAAAGTGSAYPGLEISVREAPGTKCPRCWMHSVDADPETGLCPRCREVLKSL